MNGAIKAPYLPESCEPQVNIGRCITVMRDSQYLIRTGTRELDSTGHLKPSIPMQSGGESALLLCRTVCVSGSDADKYLDTTQE